MGIPHNHSFTGNQLSFILPTRPAMEDFGRHRLGGRPRDHAFPKAAAYVIPYPRLSPQSRFASAQQELLQTLEHLPFSTLSLRNTLTMLTL